MSEPTKYLRMAETNDIGDVHSLNNPLSNMSELTHVLEKESVEATKDVTSTHGLKHDENDVTTNSGSAFNKIFPGSAFHKIFPTGSATTMPIWVEDTCVSVNLSKIPSDPTLLNRVAFGAKLAVWKLSPENNYQHGKPIPAEFIREEDKIAAEIRKKIYKSAMTAVDGALDFTDKVSRFRPNIATGLLRVSRRVYHDAKPFLYSENDFCFNRCGTDMYLLDQTPKLEGCKLIQCSMTPIFSNVVFDIGDDESIDMGQFKIQTFTAALRALKNEVKIGRLQIYFRDFCWAATERAEGFANALGKFKILQSLEMNGPDFLWSENLAAIPKALAMNVTPVCAFFQPGTEEQYFKGFFHCKYCPAMTVEETQGGVGEVVDPGFLYREHWESLGEADQTV